MLTLTRNVNQSDNLAAGQLSVFHKYCLSPFSAATIQHIELGNPETIEVTWLTILDARQPRGWVIASSKGFPAAQSQAEKWQGKSVYFHNKNTSTRTNLLMGDRSTLLRMVLFYSCGIPVSPKSPLTGLNAVASGIQVPTHGLWGDTSNHSKYIGQNSHLFPFPKPHCHKHLARDVYPSQWNIGKGVPLSILAHT